MHAVTVLSALRVSVRARAYVYNRQELLVENLALDLFSSIRNSSSAPDVVAESMNSAQFFQMDQFLSIIAHLTA